VNRIIALLRMAAKSAMPATEGFMGVKQGLG